MTDFRILIIDDASPDDSGTVAQALARSDPRVETVLHRANKGHIATYNEGIEWASSPYFLSLSADDFLAPGALQRAVDIMDARADVVLTYGACIETHGGELGDIQLPPADATAWMVRPGPHFVAETCDTVRNNVPTPTAIVRTAVQKAIGGYLPALYHSGDMEMWMRFAAHGSIAVTPFVQAFYRLHGKNMSTGIYKKVLEDYVQRQAAFDTFFANDGASVPEARRLHRLAYRRLGDAAFWTGVAQTARGNLGTGRELLDFAAKLNPDTRFWPPFAYLRRLSRPDRRAIAALSDFVRRAW